MQAFTNLGSFAKDVPPRQGQSFLEKSWNKFCFLHFDNVTMFTQP